VSLIIPDFFLVMKIAATGKSIPKTTHRWPSGKTIDGYMCNPKMNVGSDHKVYLRAPHGAHGNRAEPPMFLVRITNLWDSFPHEWTDEDMLAEGFDSLHSYGVWWDAHRAGKAKNYNPWAEMQDEPFWVCSFAPLNKTVYFDRMLEMWVKKHAQKT